jgi:peptidoglycan-N-acetylglucosamine deacetylase
MRFIRPCFPAGWFFRDALFRIRTDEKLLCLTFDDGPDPVSTPVLLDILNRYGIKALFFCCGKAASQYPELLNQIYLRNHVVGNHGYNHLDGLFTTKNEYLKDISVTNTFINSRFFRPPYGRLKISQYRSLKGKYKIVFWDIMSYDFDSGFGSKNSLEILKKKLRKGSIIVLHDTKKSTMLQFLPEFIDYALLKGYRFIVPDQN